MSSETATLNNYLSIICERPKPAEQSPKARFRQDPKLSRDCLNVILMYYGSFNPPHLGHMAVLQHAHGQLSTRMNIIAAFIITTDDESIKEKWEARGRVFTDTDRARFWTEDPHFPSWACASREFSGCNHIWLQRKLRFLAQKDGCNIQFADLFGSDLVTSDISCLDEQLTIVSDVGREPEWMKGHERDPPQFHDAGFGAWVTDDWNDEAPVPFHIQVEKWYGNWRKQSYMEDEHICRAVFRNYDATTLGSQSVIQEISNFAAAKIHYLLSGNFQTMSSTAPREPDTPRKTHLARLHKQASKVSICWTPEDELPRKSLHFVRSTCEQHAPFRGISSTELQKRMSNVKGLKLLPLLKTMALSPNIVWWELRTYHTEKDEKNTEAVTQVCSWCANRMQHSTALPRWHSNIPLEKQRTETAVDDMCLPTMLADSDRSHLHESKREPLDDSSMRLFRYNPPGPPNPHDTDTEGEWMLPQRLQRLVCHPCLYRRVVDEDLRAKEPKDGHGSAGEGKCKAEKYFSQWELGPMKVGAKPPALGNIGFSWGAL